MREKFLPEAVFMVSSIEIMCYGAVLGVLSRNRYRAGRGIFTYLSFPTLALRSVGHTILTVNVFLVILTDLWVFSKIPRLQNCQLFLGSSFCLKYPTCKVVRHP